MPPNSSLSTKLIRIGVIMLVLALTSIGLTLWLTWQLEGGAAAVNEAGRLRMQTWRLASAVQATLPPGEVDQLARRFDDSLALLRTGDPSRPLFVPWNAEVRARFGEVESLWASRRPDGLAGALPVDTAQTLREAEAFAEAIDAFVFVIEVQMSRLTALLNLFQFVMMALAIGGAIVMLYTGYLYVIHPLARLRQGLAGVEEGEFATRIEVETQDDFGEVAAGFNRMAQTLESLYQGLEAKVREKTERLQAEHARLTALYEVSAFLREAGSMDAMASGFAQRVRRVMQADAVTVRWLDEANQRYLMLAADCVPQEMIDAENCLMPGACACGSTQAEPKIRIIPVLADGPMPMRLCLKAGYDTVVAVPVRLQQRVVGEIDLFFRSAAKLGEEERALLDALASQLASAIEGLRAAALEREAAIAEERAMLARELHDSIAQSLAFMKIQVQLLRQAQQRRQPELLRKTLDELDAGVRESLNDVRELLVHFRTRTNAGEIERALLETLQKFEHQTGLPAHLHVQGDGLPLPADVQVQVLHVLQEALSNVRKHAGASRVWLDVNKGPRWRFSVRDDGCGFAPDLSRADSHVGLHIMRERATRIGAELVVESAPEAGTAVTLTLAGPSLPATRDNRSEEMMK